MALDGVLLSSPRTLGLLNLPLELVQHILAMLPAAERAVVAPTCRHLAAALAESAVATSSCWRGGCWREGTVTRGLLSASGVQSLLTWAAICSRDVQRLWLMAPIIVRADDIVDEDDMDMTHMVLGLLHAVHTLRIDSFHDTTGAAICTMVLATKTSLMHLALYNLTLPPDDPQLVKAIRCQCKLVELTLGFQRGTAVDATATVLTAAGACRMLKQLCVKATEPYSLGLPGFPASLVAHAALAGIDLQLCGLAGLQQLPANLASLKVADCSAYQLPASLARMTALTQLAASSLTEAPPAWPTHLKDLKVPLREGARPSTLNVLTVVGGQRWDTAAEALLGPCLARLAAVTALRFLHLDSCKALGTCTYELDKGTAPLMALKGLALTRCSLLTLPQLGCLSRLQYLTLSHNRFPEVPQSLAAATAIERLDLCNTLNAAECLNDSSILVLSRLTALTRLIINAVPVQRLATFLGRAERRAQVRLSAIVDLMAQRKPGKALPNESLFPAALPDVTSPLKTERGWMC